MKFNIQFITILAAASFAFADDESIPVDVSKLDENDFTSFPSDLTNNECLNLINSLDNCFTKTFSGAQQFEETCANFASEQCQKFEKTSIMDMPECKDTDKLVLFGVEEMIKINFQATKFECGKDENGNYCPLTSISLEKNYQYNKIINESLTESQVAEIYDKAMTDTCKSKKCSDDFFIIANEVNKDPMVIIQETIKSKTISDETKKEHETIIKNEQKRILENFDVNKIITYLKKENCISEEALKNNNSGATEDSKSDASQVTYSSVLFVSLALLLLSLL